MLDIKPAETINGFLINELPIRLPKPLLRSISTWLDAQHQEMDTAQQAEPQLAQHAVVVMGAIVPTHTRLLPTPPQGMVPVVLVVAVADLAVVANLAGRELAHPLFTPLQR